jgi:hypothetical protein
MTDTGAAKTRLESATSPTGRAFVTWFPFFRPWRTARAFALCRERWCQEDTPMVQAAHGSNCAPGNPQCLGKDLNDKHASTLFAHSGATAWTQPLRTQLNAAGGMTFYRFFQQGFKARSNTVLGEQPHFNIQARNQIKKSDLEWMVANWPPKIKELDSCIRQSHADLEISDAQLSTASQMLKQLTNVIEGPVKQLLKAFESKPEAQSVVLDMPWSSVGGSGSC